MASMETSAESLGHPAASEGRTSPPGGATVNLASYMESASLHLYTLLSTPSLAPLELLTVTLGNDSSCSGIDVLSEVMWWLARHHHGRHENGEQDEVPEQCFCVLLNQLSRIQRRNIRALSGLVSPKLLDALAEYLKRQWDNCQKLGWRGQSNQIKELTTKTLDLLLACVQSHNGADWLERANLDFLHPYVNPPSLEKEEGLEKQDEGCPFREKQQLLAIVVLARGLSPKGLCEITISENLWPNVSSSMETYHREILKEHGTGRPCDSFAFKVGRGLVLALSKLSTDTACTKFIATHHSSQIPILLEIMRHERENEKRSSLQILGNVFPYIEDETLNDYVKRDIIDVTYHVYEDPCLRQEALVMQGKIRDRVLKQSEALHVEMTSHHTSGAPEKRQMLDVVIGRIGDCIRRNMKDKLWFILHGMNAAQRRHLAAHVPATLGKRPLIHEAIRLGCLDTIRFLSEEWGACIDVEHEHQSSVCVAVANARLGILKHLVQNGARLDYVPREFHTTPLIDASRKGQVDTVRYLVDNGVKVDQVDCEGNTCVHALSAYKKSPEWLLELFIFHGADLNRRNQNGRTPLHLAVENRHVSRSIRFLEVLLGRGADFTLLDNEGLTPLGRAVEKRDKEAILALVAHNAHLVPCNDSGLDLFQFAATSELHLIVAYLIEKLYPPAKKKLEVYELLVSHSVKKVSLELLQTIFQLRAQVGDKLTVLESCTVYSNGGTFGSLEEPDLADDEQQMMCSLYLREVVLGRFHPKVFEGLTKCAASLERKRNYGGAYRLLKYATTLQEECCKTKGLLYSEACIRGIKQYTSLLKTIQRNASYLNVDFADILQLVTVACSQMKGLESEAGENDALRGAALTILVDLLHTAIGFFLDEEQLKRIRQVVRPVVGINPTDSRGRGMLTRSLDIMDAALLQSPRSVTMDFLYVEWTLQEQLLQCGAVAHHLDSDRNSALHGFLARLVRRKIFHSVSTVVTEVVARRFLEAGVHMDSKNVRGETVEGMLEELGVKLNRLEHVSLKCLAARTLREGVPNYRLALPSKLCEYVDLH